MKLRSKIARMGVVFALLASSLTIAAPASLANATSCGDPLHNVRNIYDGARQGGGMSLNERHASSTQSMSGVQGTLTVFHGTNNWNMCLGTNVFMHGMIAAVTIKPNGTANGCEYTGTIGSPACFLSLGIVECYGQNDWDYAFSPECAGDGHPHWFYQEGGCGVDAYTNIVDGGDATYGNHTLSIWLDHDGVWNMQVDATLFRRVSMYHADIACWAQQSTMARWEGIQTRVGDSIGGSTGYSRFVSMHYGYLNQGWFNTNFVAGSNCTTIAHNAQCWSPNSTSMDMVTYN